MNIQLSKHHLLRKPTVSTPKMGECATAWEQLYKTAGLVPCPVETVGRAPHFPEFWPGQIDVWDWILYLVVNEAMHLLPCPSREKAKQNCQHWFVFSFVS